MGHIAMICWMDIHVSVLLVSLVLTVTKTLMNVSHHHAQIWVIAKMVLMNSSVTVQLALLVIPVRQILMIANKVPVFMVASVRMD
jgi:hypothetical protein